MDQLLNDKDFEKHGFIKHPSIPNNYTKEVNEFIFTLIYNPKLELISLNKLIPSMRYSDYEFNSMKIENSQELEWLLNRNFLYANL